MLRVVTALNVPFIDLEKKTATLFRASADLLQQFNIQPGTSNPFSGNGRDQRGKTDRQGVGELSTDTTVAPLAAELAPQYMITVKSNKTGAGLVTASGTYPQGAPITLEVIPNSGERFRIGRTQAVNQYQPKHLSVHHGAAATSYGAILRAALPKSRTKNRFPPFVRCPPFQYRVPGLFPLCPVIKLFQRGSRSFREDILRSEPNGTCATLDVSSFTHGIYFVSARTGAGSATQLIRR